MEGGKNKREEERQDVSERSMRDFTRAWEGLLNSP